jgi:hypothetical protein
MDHIMNLDVCVLRALQYLREHKDQIREFQPETDGLTLVAGSGNAILTGQYIHRNAPAVYANQDDFEDVWLRFGGRDRIDQLTLMTATGGRDAVTIARYFQEHGLARRRLVTNTPDAQAAPFCTDVIVLPQMPGEPHTYNVSTYMSMLVANSGEDPEAILACVESLEVPRDIGDYPAYYFLVPAEYEPVAEMFNIKFREIFGSHVYGRASTEAHANHGLFVNRSNEELVVGLNVDNPWRGYRRVNLHVPCIGDDTPGALLAAGYYLIGQIQRRKPSWFRENLFDYVDAVNRALGWNVRPFS